jgi:CheY-like chemotaxis protein
MPPRILVVEDDLLVQEFVAAALQERGYNVDVTGDGFTAAQLLSKDDYDLALVDYQLPEIDGYASARMMRSLSGTKTPKMIAMTGNAAALEQRAGAREIFDDIVPKSYDAKALLQLVEKALAVPQHTQLMEESLQAWGRLGLPRRPVAKVVPEPSRVQRLALVPWFETGDTCSADFILLTDSSATPWLTEARAHGDAHLLPVVEIESIRSGFAEASFDAHRKEALADIASTIKRFTAKRRQLSDDALHPRDLDIRILSYLFLSGRPLQPVADPSRPLCVRYPGFFPDSELIAAAERLAHRGFLSRQFAHRFHHCSACHSHRLNVCEECPSCQSANLQQVEIIHHFRCAHQAPESQFRSGTHLICPKCRQHLRHYGGDYDKPGSMLICENCDNANSDPTVGFACLDCGAHMNGDAAATRDVFSYALTRRGEAFVTCSVVTPALVGPPSRQVIPRSIAEALDKVFGETAGMLEDFIVLEVRYGAESRILEHDGAKAFSTLRRLFVENMHNLLAEYGCVVPHDDVDYVIVNANKDESNASFAFELMTHSQAGLSHDLDPSCRVIDIKEAMAAA